MMPKETLFMLLLGCRPPGRNTEQHDVFFGIGETLKDLVPAIKRSWPEAKANIHIDAWRRITCVDGYNILVNSVNEQQHIKQKNLELFFINLGGYKENEFEEFHYKMVVIAGSFDEAKNNARKTAFFKHASVKPSATHINATAHIDDKFGIDVDDACKLKDILPEEFKEKYRLTFSPLDNCYEKDELHLGYLRLIDV